MSNEDELHALHRPLVEDAREYPDYHDNTVSAIYGYSEGVEHALVTVWSKGYRKPRTITTVEELDALPVRSVVLAHWEDGSQPDYTVMRCAEGGASSSGYGLAGTRHWLGMAKWGATLTVLYEPLP